MCFKLSAPWQREVNLERRKCISLRYLYIYTPGSTGSFHPPKLCRAKTSVSQEELDKFMDEVSLILRGNSQATSEIFLSRCYDTNSAALLLSETFCWNQKYFPCMLYPFTAFPFSLFIWEITEYPLQPLSGCFELVFLGQPNIKRKRKNSAGRFRRFCNQAQNCANGITWAIRR